MRDVLDGREIVFAMREPDPESGVGIGPSEDVRYAEIVRTIRT